MTDPEFADATYIEPITPEYVAKVIAKERPDALLATLGGQTALNTAMALHEQGVLEQYDVELIGADIDAIKAGEDRMRFKEIVASIGAERARSAVCNSLDEVRDAVDDLGGCNIQFAVNPDDGRIVVIEMNPRVSRSSALASKATGFPIAKIAAKLAVGYTLDEIPNDITRETPASFEPSLDYVVVKVPRWAFEKFPRADRTLTTQMKSVGEVMAIGRTFKEAFMKAFRSLELGRGNMLFARSGGRIDATAAVEADEDDGALQRSLAVPNDRRRWALF